MDILYTIIIGFIIGLVARFLKPGDDSMGIIATTLVGVGGSFDVVSGNIPRAPMWMQRANLEWLFRMMQEPKRLVRRYLVGNTRFYMLLRKESKGSKANV